MIISRMKKSFKFTVGTVFVLMLVFFATFAVLAIVVENSVAARVARSQR